MLFEENSPLHFDQRRLALPLRWDDAGGRGGHARETATMGTPGGGLRGCDDRGLAPARIRRRAREQLALESLVPEPVARIIETRRLYADSESQA